MANVALGWPTWRWHGQRGAGMANEVATVISRSPRQHQRKITVEL